MNQKETDKSVVNSIGGNSSIGYILEFDLEYPDELPESHDYPLAPEKLEISHMLSNYCSSIANKWHKNESINKLVQNLDNKSTYILHYRNLQLYLSSGMKLVSVHRIRKFK